MYISVMIYLPKKDQALSTSLTVCWRVAVCIMTDDTMELISLEENSHVHVRFDEGQYEVRSIPGKCLGQ